MKIKSLLIASVVSIIGFIAIAVCTISPDVYSGNGNPALLFYPVAIVPYGILLYLIIQHASQISLTRLKWAGFLAVILFILCILGEIYQVQQLIAALGGGPDNPESKIYRFGWLNQYTNTFYFNPFTFMLGVTVSVGVGLMKGRFFNETKN